MATLLLIDKASKFCSGEGARGHEKCCFVVAIALPFELIHDIEVRGSDGKHAVKTYENRE